VLTAEATDCCGAAGPDPDFDVDVLEVAAGVAVDVVAVADVLAVVAEAVAAVFVVVRGLLATRGATVEILLICMVSYLPKLKTELARGGIGAAVDIFRDSSVSGTGRRGDFVLRPERGTRRAPLGPFRFKRFRLVSVLR
jgi:hypothetical protein